MGKNAITPERPALIKKAAAWGKGLGRALRPGGGYPGARQAARPNQQENLKKQLEDCLAELRRNENLFDWQTEPELVEVCIYRRVALLAQYQYLLRKLREDGSLLQPTH